MGIIASQLDLTSGWLGHQGKKPRGLDSPEIRLVGKGYRQKPSAGRDGDARLVL